MIACFGLNASYCRCSGTVCTCSSGGTSAAQTTSATVPNFLFVIYDLPAPVDRFDSMPNYRRRDLEGGELKTWLIWVGWKRRTPRHRPPIAARRPRFQHLARRRPMPRRRRFHANHSPRKMP